MVELHSQDVPGPASAIITAAFGLNNAFPPPKVAPPASSTQQMLDKPNSQRIAPFIASSLFVNEL